MKSIINTLKEELENEIQYVDSIDSFCDFINNIKQKYINNKEYYLCLVALIGNTKFQYNVPQCIFPTTDEVVRKIFNVHQTTTYIDKDESDDGYYVVDLIKSPVTVIEYIEI